MDKVGLKIPFFPINLRHIRSSLVLLSVINPKKILRSDMCSY